MMGRVGWVFGVFAVTCVVAFGEEFRFRTGPGDEKGKWIEGELLGVDADGTLRIQTRFGAVVSRPRSDLLERRPDLEERLESLDPSRPSGYLDLAVDVLGDLGRMGRSSAELEGIAERLVRIAAQLEGGLYLDGCRCLAGRWESGRRVGGLRGPDRAFHYAERLLVAHPEEPGIVDLVDSLTRELAGPRSEIEELLGDLPGLLAPSARGAFLKRLHRFVEPYRGNLEALQHATSHDPELSGFIDLFLRGICLPCDLGGRVRCSSCRGEGTRIVRCTGCPVDRGRSLWICQDCDGSGLETRRRPGTQPRPCPDCLGKPRRWIDCAKCGEETQRGRERVDCSACGGRGTRSCS